MLISQNIMYSKLHYIPKIKNPGGLSVAGVKQVSIYAI